MRRCMIGTLLFGFALMFTLGAQITCADGSNLVTNGGFETGDFTGWIVTGPGCSAVVASLGESLACLGGFVNEVPPHSGTFAAIFPLGGTGTISQTLATNLSDTYILAFWLSSVDNGFGVSPNGFDASWGGDSLLSLSDISADGYTEYIFSGLVPTGSSTTISFSGFDSPAALGLDDVSVAAVPEPSSLLSLSAGLLGLMAARRQRQQA